MISVFSDRIEILSRGSLAPEQTMEGFFAGESVPVNHKLSEIMLQLHISEKTGRGVPKITQRYGKEAFEFRENSIVVTIPFNWINVMARESRHESEVEAESGILQDLGTAKTQKPECEAEQGIEKKAAQEAEYGNASGVECEVAQAAGKEAAQDDVLNKTQKRILAELQKNPDMTKARLADVLNLGKTTIDNGISVLKKYGFIKRVGSNKLGYWKLCRNGKTEG